VNREIEQSVRCREGYYPICSLSLVFRRYEVKGLLARGVDTRQLFNWICICKYVIQITSTAVSRGELWQMERTNLNIVTFNVNKWTDANPAF
jgi:hypothetical protein